MHYARRGHWSDDDQRYRNLFLDTNLSDEVAAQAQLSLEPRMVVSSWWSIRNALFLMETSSNCPGTKPASMISGKVTREIVPPKCNRGEFGHHAQREASIGYYHRINTPTRLQDTRKPAARLSPNHPPSFTSNRASPPAQTCTITSRTFIRGRSP